MLGQIFVISAPSGGGKTSLISAALADDPVLKVSISHTTRPMRPGETHGVNYFFVDKTEFSHMIDNQAFIEQATVFGQQYGTSRNFVIEQVKQGFDVILELDWQGDRQIKQAFPNSIGIFILPPSLAALEERLRARKQDKEEVIAQRMQQAVAEMSHYLEYQYIIINRDFNQAKEDLLAIFKAERLKKERQVQKNSQLLEDLLI